MKRVTHQPSSISGGNVNLRADKGSRDQNSGIKISGSKISATENLDINSSGSVIIDSVQDTVETETRSSSFS